VQTSAASQADKMQTALKAKPDYDKLRTRQRQKLQEEIASNRAATLKKNEGKAGTRAKTGAAVQANALTACCGVS
jgi:hypothetical protein